MIITTLEQLEAVPPETALRVAGNYVFRAEYLLEHSRVFGVDLLPATVLIPSVITLGQLHNVEDAIEGLDWTQLEHGIAPENKEIALAVLTTLGIEVEK